MPVWAQDQLASGAQPKEDYPCDFNCPSTVLLSDPSPILVRLSGLVHGSTKAPLQGVRIELRSPSDGTTVVRHTNSAGLFRYDVPEGKYELTAASRTQRISQEIHLAAGRSWISLTLKEKPRTIRARAISILRLQVPRLARQTFEKAGRALRRNDPAAATRYVDRAIGLYPRYVEALAARSILERDTNPKSALADAELAVKYDANYGEGYVALASAYTSLGRFDDAIRALDRGLDLVPDLWLGSYEMSRTLICKQEYTAALDYLEISSALAPRSYPFLHITRADAFTGLHNNSAAIHELEAYVREAPHGEHVAQAKQRLESLKSP